MHYHVDDTIVALASASGPAARGIVRLSGPQTLAVLSAIDTSFDLSALPAHPSVRPTQMRLSSLNRQLPVDMYVWPDARSYTRQLAAELHTFGSPPLLEALLEELIQHGARLASPGEFTLRAFLAGRIDLTQAEAVLGVIEAQAEDELHAALAQLAGGLAKPLADMRERLLDLLARLEAGLDFVEEDIAFIQAEELTGELNAALEELSAIQDQLGQRARLDRPPRVALIGPPNAGKTSLFNRLAGAQALVSDQPGTTRDYLTAQLELDGLLCELIDTAGLDAESTSGSIERSAQRQTYRAAQDADIRVFCVEASHASATPGELADANDGPAIEFRPDQDLRVLTKVDQSPTQSHRSDAIQTSAHSGIGLPELRHAIRGSAQRLVFSSARTLTVTAARAGENLSRARQALIEAHVLAAVGGGDELVASALRAALSEIGQVSGAVATDDLLDRIFSRFCIGK